MTKKSVAFFAILILRINTLYAGNFAVTGISDPAPFVQALEAARKSHYHRFLNDDNPKDWSSPAHVKVIIQDTGGSGETSYASDNDIRCIVRGNINEVLADVIPHEVCHMVMHSYFHAPALPRWWDEGLATCCESQQFQIHKYDLNLYNDMTKSSGFATSELWEMKEYPTEMYKFYGQSHSQVTFMLSLKPEAECINFMVDALKTGKYKQALKDHYGFESLDDFQTAWVKWIPSQQVTNDCHWDQSTGRWHCDGGGGTNIAIGVRPRISPDDGVKPTPNPVAPTPQIDLGPLATILKDGQEKLKTQLAEQHTQLQSTLGGNNDKLQVVLGKTTSALSKIEAIAASPVGQAVNTQILPAVLSATGLGGLSAILLFVNGIMKRKSAVGLLTGNVKTDLGALVQKTLTAPKPVTLPDLSNLLQQLIPRIQQPQIQQPQQGVQPLPPEGYFPGYAAPAVPLGRNQAEAVSTLQLAQLEGRNPVFDAIAGRLMQDKLQNAIDGGDKTTSVVAQKLLNEIIAAVNAMTPLSTSTGAN